MNGKELPSDDWHSDAESAEEPERLSEIEQRLKATRPSPVQLDGAAWERIISASETSAMPEPLTARPTGRPDAFARRWHSRSVGTIAAVWLSGVIVGSGVMFLMMNRGPGMTHADNRETPVELAQQNFNGASASPETRSRSEHRPSDVSIDTPTAEATSSDSLASSPTSDDEERLPVLMTGSVREVRFASWLDAPGFGPEEPLRPFGSELFDASAPVHPAPSRSSKTKPQKERLQQSELQRELARSFVPPPAATPRRILEELQMDGDALGRTL